MDAGLSLVEGSLAGPGQALCRERDEVMAHHGGVNQGLDLAAPERRPGQPPECTAAMAAHADAPQDARAPLGVAVTDSVAE